MNEKLKLLLTRRNLGKAAVFTGVAAAGSFAFPKLVPAEKSLRPPGAEDKQKFLGTCIKCGQCVQVCPYRSVRLLDIEKGLESATPAIFPHVRACYLCDLLPCVLSCPSGALDHNVSDPKDVRMGKANVVAPEKCYGMTGAIVTNEDMARLIAHGAETPEEKELAEKLSTCVDKKCTICRDFCPYPNRDEAIELVNDGERYYPKIKDKCAGCGVCLELCPSVSPVFTIESLSDRQKSQWLF